MSLAEQKGISCPFKYVEFSITCCHRYEESILGRKGEGGKKWYGRNPRFLRKKSELIIAKSKEVCDSNSMDQTTNDIDQFLLKKM